MHSHFIKHPWKCNHSVSCKNVRHRGCQDHDAPHVELKYPVGQDLVEDCWSSSQKAVSFMRRHTQGIRRFWFDFTCTLKMLEIALCVSSNSSDKVICCFSANSELQTPRSSPCFSHPQLSSQKSSPGHGSDQRWRFHQVLSQHAKWNN